MRVSLGVGESANQQNLPQRAKHTAGAKPGLGNYLELDMDNDGPLVFLRGHVSVLAEGGVWTFVSTITLTTFLIWLLEEVLWARLNSSSGHTWPSGLSFQALG